jgi:signal transduction histidine kinase
VPALHKDSQRLSMALTVALLRAVDGRLTGIAAIVRDDTERWQEEQTSRRRLTALEGRAASA